MRLSSFVINPDGLLWMGISTAIANLLWVVEVSFGHVTFELRYFYVIVELILIIADFLVQFPFKYSL